MYTTVSHCNSGTLNIELNSSLCIEVLLRKNGGNIEEIDNPPEHLNVEFEVESYLRYQGQSFVSRFDANTYLYLTKALDRFDLHGPVSLDETLSKVTAPGLVIGFTSDWLYPPQGNREVVEALLRLGKQATYAELAMDLGHDSFLVRAPKLYKLIDHFLSR